MPEPGEPGTPPRWLIDETGEGIYGLSDWHHPGPSLREVASVLDVTDEGGRLAWRAVEMGKMVWMRWHRKSLEWRRSAAGWRLNLPRRWRPVAYTLYSPPQIPPEAPDA